jgi:hypothetical protein
MPQRVNAKFQQKLRNILTNFLIVARNPPISQTMSVRFRCPPARDAETTSPAASYIVP